MMVLKRICPATLVVVLLMATAPAWAVIVASGTELEVKLIDRISSKNGQEGQTFRGALAQSVLVDGAIALRAGSAVTIVLTEVRKGGPIRRAKIVLELSALESGGKTQAITSSATMFVRRRDGSVIARAYAGAAGATAAGSVLTQDPKKIKRLQAIGAAAAALFAGKRQHLEFAPGTTLTFLLADAFKPNSISRRSMADLGLQGESRGTERPEGERSVPTADQVSENTRSDGFEDSQGFAWTMEDVCREFPDLEECQGDPSRVQFLGWLEENLFWIALLVHGLASLAAKAYVWRLTILWNWESPQSRLAFKNTFWTRFYLISLPLAVVASVLLSILARVTIGMLWLGGASIGLGVAVIGKYGVGTHIFRVGAERRSWVGAVLRRNPPVSAPPPPSRSLAGSSDPGVPDEQ